MRRRDFLTAGAAGAIAGAIRPDALVGQSSTRGLFPRLEHEVFLNGAGGTPLGRFAENAVERYLALIREGPGNGRGAWWGGVWDDVRGRFATLIGAREEEVGLVECTKAGEQIVLDALPALRTGGSIVTNDLHFSGSLHNLEGLRRAGTDVRVVRSEDFRVPAERMIEAIDERTALVTVSLVSNVNGHVESIEEIAEAAHAHGALVFADIIQAAGIVPVDVHAMGIDVAACSSYKWLYGIHGAGFLFVSSDVQGTALEDRLFPGHVRRTYPPFAPDGSAGSMTWSAPGDARRYQPGHVSYLGYAAVHAGLAFVQEEGVDRLLEHTVALNRRLLDRLDSTRYRVLSTHLDHSPILALEASDFDGTLARLQASDVVVGAGGDKWNLLRISPAAYNVPEDVDRLAEVLNG